MKPLKSFTLGGAPLVSTRAAAAALGVSESSVKRWCDQGRLEVVKTPGGHRRLRLESVQLLARETGQSVGALALEGAGAPPGLKQARVELRRSLLSGDEPGALAAFEKARRAVGGMAELADDVIAPVLAEVGVRWSRGAVQVYEERRACDLLFRALSRLSEHLPTPQRPGLSALGGSLPGDPFTLPSLLVELVLRESGFAARSLGNELPVETLEKALHERRPQLLWISVGAVTAERDLLRAGERLHQAASAHGASLVLGGRGLSASLRRRLRYAAYCESMTGLRELALALSRVSRS